MARRRMTVDRAWLELAVGAMLMIAGVLVVLAAVIPALTLGSNGSLLP